MKKPLSQFDPYGEPDATVIVAVQEDVWVRAACGKKNRFPDRP